jgi:hypothetical protein
MLISNTNANVYPRVNRSSTSYEAGWKLSTGGSDSWYLGLRSGGGVGSYHFYSYTTNSSVVSITSGGNVLVGTTTDNGYKLQINGSVSSTGGYFDTSDSRLKTLLEDNYLLNSIANVKAKLYIKNGQNELGYYAQDLQAILPSAVSEGKDGFLSLSYAQVHTAKIAVIEDKVTILENEVAELKSKLQKYDA